MFRILMLLLLVACFSSAAYAYPPSIFDIRQQLEDASLVCYGKVISLDAHEVTTNIGQTVKGWLAKVEVIGNIKGDADATIEVLFRGDSAEQMRDYTTLAKDESAILFLKKSKDGPYQFHNEENSKLAVPAHKALEYKSKTPEGHLIEELLFATLNDKTYIGLHCVEELKHFPTPEVVSQLKELSKSADIGTQGVAYATLVALDEPPEADRLTAFFKRDDGPVRFPTAAFSILHLKTNIIQKMESRFNCIGRDFELRSTDKREVERRDAARAATEKWKQFNVVSFISAILEEDSKKAVFDGDKEGVALRDMADILGRQIDNEGRPAKISGKWRVGTRRMLAQLVQHDQQEVNFSAAKAIDVMLAPHKFSYPKTMTKDDISKYVDECREFLKVNSDWAKRDER